MNDDHLLNRIAMRLPPMTEMVGASIDRISREAQATNPINHPKHYTNHPSGVECITITEHMSFNLGNATKYIWRADLKSDAIEDLKKARWYIEREIHLREKANG